MRWQWHVGLVIAYALVVWVAAAAAVPHGPQAVINITQTQVRHSGSQVKVDDDEFWLYHLHNTRITPAVIGYSTLRCEFIGRGGVLGTGASDCSAIYSLAKGKLTARGIVKSRSYYALAVTGGTGIYSAMSGQVLASTIAARPHEERLLFGLEP